MREIRRLLVLQHLEIEGPGLFEQFTKEKDLQIEVVRLDKKDPRFFTFIYRKNSSPIFTFLLLYIFYHSS